MAVSIYTKGGYSIIKMSRFCKKVLLMQGRLIKAIQLLIEK